MLLYNKGVYIIRPKSFIDYCKGDFYIGMTTTSFEKRHQQHLRELRSGTHASKKMQEYYDKYGVKALIMRPVFRCNDNLAIMNKEAKLIAKLKPKLNKVIPKFKQDPMTIVFVTSLIWLLILLLSHIL